MVWFRSRITSAIALEDTLVTTTGYGPGRLSGLTQAKTLFWGLHDSAFGVDFRRTVVRSWGARVRRPCNTTAERYLVSDNMYCYHEHTPSSISPDQPHGATLSLHLFVTDLKSLPDPESYNTSDRQTLSTPAPTGNLRSQYAKAANYNFAPPSLSFFASSLRIRFKIFPLAFFGMTSTNLIPP